MTSETNQIKLRVNLSVEQMNRILDIEERGDACCLFECLNRLEFVRSVEYDGHFPGPHVWIDIMAEDDSLKNRKAILAQIEEYLEDEQHA